MTHILLFGFGPLPHEGLRMSGPGLRTWHFTSVLLQAGHDVTLLADRLFGAYPDDLPSLITTAPALPQSAAGAGGPAGRWTYHSIADTLWHNPAGLKALVEAAGAECAIGVTTTACAVAAEVIGGLPFWCDLYGSIMAEAQLKALVYGDDSHLTHFFNFERKAIERGDIFSSVSDRQGWSLIGELGLWGRLNQWTAGYDFVSTIPIASETAPYTLGASVIRGIHAQPSDFVILYSGGYNTWTDVDTLFAALEAVFAARAGVVFVSTGGRIDGHDDVTYARFQRLTQSSRFADRYHLCGWVPTAQVPDYYLESDLGVNVDRPSYEALLGSRTRILDWMRAELPAVSSDLTELARDTAAAGAGLLYKPGDSAGLCAALLRCIDDPPFTAQMGLAARRLLHERFTFEGTTVKLCAWAANPTHAPDFGKPPTRLVAPAQGVGVGIAQAIERRSLGLGLAVQLWPVVARVTDALGLRPVQKWLHRAGMRLLRLDRPPYRAMYHGFEPPRTMQAGATYPLHGRIRNDGTTTWIPASTEKGFNASYHWKTPDGKYAIKGGARTALPGEVRGGKAVAIVLQVMAPPEPGAYCLELDMVREGVTWFSEAGAAGPTFSVAVTEVTKTS
jgi:glycosyltransferase involved in cell wall biosynthesis